ncbi:uncharacterized protein BO80DRAFT_441396 [Aspergillus ibericus CBS 121593]|uniref:Uncharacterized protein n=1 Tax=Aspergillus ibericus CBS 121593 TaxID=1448316 RepID=A0A395HC33_9EURO|nr:hypothetical protein BO80DRAFT_441396 [Aspergillus ibericus CBS 121593]RAL04518.1 hypothetical protein BO80DRAFT_441396 [Aspergillus ibericus CBS 121593]
MPPYPEDLSGPVMRDSPTASSNHDDPARLGGFIRAMAGVGRVADQVFLKIYSPASVTSMAHLSQLPAVTAEIDGLLSALTRDLPLYLHFFDPTLPIGSS